MTDERTLFSKTEIVQALSLEMPLAEAQELATSMFEHDDLDPDLNSVHLSEGLLELLCLVSDSCAQRVRVVLNLTEAELEVMRSKARKRYLP